MSKIIKNLTYAEYDKIEGISNSKLSKIAISPAHYKLSLESPQKETDALRFGSLLHCLILDPQNFEKEFAIEPIVNKRTNAGKEFLEDFYLKNEGKTIITEEQLELASILKDKLLQHPIASKLLSGKGENEVSLFWTDDETGVRCKCKIDRIKNDIIIDLKTARSTKPEDFKRQAYDLGYHRQAAWYLSGFEKCYQRPAKSFVFVTIEKEPPYSITIFEPTELLKEVGIIETSKLLATYKDCLDKGQFYGYDGAEPTIQSLEPPNWVLNKYGLNEDDIFE